MKKILLYLVLSCGTSMAAFAQTTINVATSGFTFSPANTAANVGDSVKFTVGGSHTATEVSEATWNANGNTPLSGGFNFSSGTHKIKLTQAKTYYFVCSPHASMPMKGKIVVSAASTSQTINISTTNNLKFSPENATANVGDSVKFTIGGGHTATEVSEATWNASGSTPLSGGFNFSSGTHKMKLTQAKTYYYVCSPHAGAGMKGKIVVSAVTGVADKISAVSSFQVYPNPVTESSVAKFNLVQPSDVNITVYNLLGAALHRVAAGKLSAGNHTIPFAAADLAHGMYLLEITAGSQRIVKKIAVQ